MQQPCTATCSARLEDHVTVRKADVLARHAWDDTGTLDLFADPEASADAVGHLVAELDAAAQCPDHLPGDGQALFQAQVAAGANLVADLMSHDIPSTLTVNNYFGVLQAVLNHLGIGVLPDYLTDDFPNLVRVLPEIESAEVPVFLAYPEELRHSKRVAAFREFVSEEIFKYRKREQG